VMVVFAPVLSPQFLLWILPVSACAYGLRKENLVLLVALILTQVVLQNYDGVDSLSGGFVWPLAARNLTLLLYLYLVCRPILGRQAKSERAGSPLPTRRLTSDPVGRRTRPLTTAPEPGTGLP
jgi:hypothetical protein